MPSLGALFLLWLALSNFDAMVFGLSYHILFYHALLFKKRNRKNLNPKHQPPAKKGGGTGIGFVGVELGRTWEELKKGKSLSEYIVYKYFFSETYAHAQRKL